MTVHWLTSASIRPPFLIMVLSLLPSRFFMTRHLILPGKSEVGGILTEMRSVRRYLRSRQLLTHPSWLTSRLLTSSQPMKQPWVTSSTSSYRYVRPESVDLHFHHGSTWSVEPYVAKPAVLKDYIVAPDCPLIDLHGCTLHRRYRDKDRSYWEAKITSNAKDSKRLWATFDAILGRRRADPQCDAPSFSADDFLASFKKKIADTAHLTPPVFHPTDCKLSNMNAVTSAELRCIILTSPPKSCELDPIPTFLLQEFVDDLLPFLTALCNRSIHDGVLPRSQKRSVLVPVLKCSRLDSADPLNFRPIANVSFMSKIIEKIAAYQLTVYLETNKLLPECQSGFRRGHSTETLLFHLLSDIYGAVDSSQLTLLALFDVSAAFDTVDHEILLKRLEISFGLSGNFLSWVGSFLSERSLCVVQGPSRSAWVPAPYGLPQGSVLGPLLYIIYTSEIGPLLSATSVLGHLYADDIQAYLHCPASNATSAVLAISKTLDVLETWMSTNRLRLNPSKTQFIWFGTRQQLAKLDLSAIAADFPHFIFSPVVRDLGLTLDQELTFAPHIHRLCRDSYYQLRQLRTVIRTLTSESTATLIHAFITARLDYCSSLYAGLPVGRLRCLDRVLRTAACLSGRIPKFGHVSRYMLDVLHWLPLQQRISYRIISLVWRSLLDFAPAYLRDLCHTTMGIPGRRSLHSTEQGLLLVPFAHTAIMQNRAFSVVGPSLWNGQSLALRLFPRIVSNFF